VQEAQDADALELLLAERGTQLMRTAVLLAGGRQDGEDLLQAALERLIKQGRRITGDPEGCLRRTLYNLAADGWRRRETWRRKLPVFEASQPTTAPDLTAAVDLRDALIRALHQLSSQQRAESCGPMRPPTCQFASWHTVTTSASRSTSAGWPRTPPT